MPVPFVLRSRVCVLVLACVGSVHAMDIATYEKQRKEPPTAPSQTRLRSYLLGIGEGLRLANVALRERDQTLLFCPPEGTSYGVDDYKRLIDGALDVARATYVRQDLSVETLLLRILQDRHPCPVRERPAAAERPAALPAVRPAEPAAEKPAEKPSERSPEKPPEKPPEKVPEAAPEKGPEKPPEKPPEPASEKAPEKAPGGSPDQPPDKPGDNPKGSDAGAAGRTDPR